MRLNGGLYGRFKGTRQITCLNGDRARRFVLAPRGLAVDDLPFKANLGNDLYLLSYHLVSHYAYGVLRHTSIDQKAPKTRGLEITTKPDLLEKQVGFIFS